MKLICKLGELMLKSPPVRRSFLRKLKSNVKDVFRNSQRFFRQMSGPGYLVIETDWMEAPELLCRVFGIHSVAVAVTRQTDLLNDVVSFGAEVFTEEVTGKRYAVRCKRVGAHPFRSLDVERELGTRLARFGKVDLTRPDLVCRIEVRGNETSCFLRVMPGAGGLPLGTQGRALALISGGIDSPVAAWHSLKRGLRVDYLFCSLGGPAQMWGPKATAKHLADTWSYGYKPRFYSVDFVPIVSALMKTDRRYRNILLKRFFYRAADRLAARIDAEAVITGEMLGQVSSQTLSNLKTISRVTERLFLRPLVGMDKEDVIRKAREIGTLGISEHVPEFCNLAVRKPKTRSDPGVLERLERSLESGLLDRVFETVEETDLRAVEVSEPPLDIALDSVPRGMDLIWIDTGESPVPQGVSDVVPVGELRRWSRSLDGERPLVLACAKGVLSRDTALYLRDMGIEAYFLTPGCFLQDAEEKPSSLS